VFVCVCVCVCVCARACVDETFTTMILGRLFGSTVRMRATVLASRGLYPYSGGIGS